MNIAAIGSKDRLLELNLILSSANLSFSEYESTQYLKNQQYDFVFLLNFDENIEDIKHLEHFNENTNVFIHLIKFQKEHLKTQNINANLVAINAFPGFLNRSILEYATFKNNFDVSIIEKLGWKKGIQVKSRVGLVSSRIIFMIINEAYFTLQEGTANREDINIGMKLGTAYPYGPFEWVEKIGLKNIYETLDALYQDTKDERYKICSLLKTEYLQCL